MLYLGIFSMILALCVGEVYAGTYEMWGELAIILASHVLLIYFLFKAAERP